jgi:hypothetical protein
MSLGWERLRRRLQVTGAAEVDSAAAAVVVEAAVVEAAAVVDSAAAAVVDSTAAAVVDSAGIWMLFAKSGMDPPDLAPGATQFEPVNPAGSVGLLDLYFPPY